MISRAPDSNGIRETHPRRWLAIALVWLVVCLFNAEQTYITLAVSGRPLPWLRVLALHAPGMVLWALCTPAIMAVAERVSLDRRGVATHVAMATLMAFLDAGLYRLIDPWVSLSGPRTLLENFVRYTQINVMNYVAVVAVTLVLRYARLLRERQVAASELSAQLSSAHLRSLQSQLRPHFLFNTLNTIAELVHTDPDAADRMIVQLSALLRRSFDAFDEQEVPLATELAFLTDYAEIMCARFEGRMRIDLQVDADAMTALVPSLILQPLVENALRHGLEPKAGGGTVEIVARRRLDLLELEVRDDGCGIASAEEDGALTWQRGSGVGLANTAGRLEHLYEDAHRFSVRPRVRGGTIVAMQLPFRSAVPAPRREGLALVR